MPVCTYCLQEFEDQLMTVDHVIARSWCPTTSLEYPQWKVPACRPCNNRYSLIERNALLSLAMCASSRDPSLKQIIESAKRSVDPRCGKTSRDARSRARARQTLKARIAPISSLDTSGLLPSFRRNFQEGSRHAIALPAEDIHTIGKKWIRGIYRSDTSEMLPSDVSVDAMFLPEDVAREMLSRYSQSARSLHMGPGINVDYRAVDEDDKHASVYEFRIWEEFKLYGFAISGE
jgi:hypothetical protein